MDEQIGGDGAVAGADDDTPGDAGATLGVIGFAAVRRTTLSWRQKLVVLLALVLLGVLVVGLQLLAHS